MMSSFKDFVIIFLILNSVNISRAEDDYSSRISGKMETETDDGKKHCTTQLHACKVSIETGPIGMPGMPGLSGLLGPKGPKGERGPIGPPGSCSCPSAAATVSSYGEPPAEMGSQSNPLVSCKTSKGSSGEYWIGLENPTKVFCDMERNLTCPILGKLSLNVAYEFRSEPFWLGHKYETDEDHGFDLEKIYGLTIDQIKSLQKEASFIRQKIKYNCKNSYVYTEYSPDTALYLLSWNDVVIGPNRSLQIPLNYIIEYDGCKDAAKEDWNHTDITIINSVVRTPNLPIVDFNIRDVRNERQEFLLEFVELCFG